ncbi:MAG: ABC transporter ATP-binding protein [Armatimonadota bacterium]
MIELQNVSKVYQGADGEVRALDDVTLSVAKGEFTAVRGPSGCGKSTLLLTVGAMVRPTEGRVLLDGQDLYALSPSHRARLRADRIGFVFQMFHLVPYLNVLENVLVPALAGAPGDRNEALELLERLQLSHRLHHRPAELSTGERQRCALARALLHRPEIILADEPTGNLDPDNAAQVLEYLAGFHRDGGTLLLVSHDPIANEYAQRVLRIEQGRVQES